MEESKQKHYYRIFLTSEELWADDDFSFLAKEAFENTRFKVVEAINLEGLTDNHFKARDIRDDNT